MVLNGVLVLKHLGVADCYNWVYFLYAFKNARNDDQPHEFPTLWRVLPLLAASVDTVLGLAIVVSLELITLYWEVYEARKGAYDYCREENLSMVFVGSSDMWIVVSILSSNNLFTLVGIGELLSSTFFWTTGLRWKTHPSMSFTYSQYSKQHITSTSFLAVRMIWCTKRFLFCHENLYTETARTVIGLTLFLSTSPLSPTSHSAMAMCMEVWH